MSLDYILRHTNKLLLGPRITISHKAQNLWEIKERHGMSIVGESFNPRSYIGNL